MKHSEWYNSIRKEAGWKKRPPWYAKEISLEVYKITTPDGIYIGSTTNGTAARFQGHLKDAHKVNRPINASIRQAEPSRVKVEVLHKVYDLKELAELELHEIIKHDSYMYSLNDSLYTIIKDYDWWAKKA